MPFTSRKQQRKCYAMKARGQAGSWNCDEWSDSTNFSKLPEKSSAYQLGQQVAKAAGAEDYLRALYEKFFGQPGAEVLGVGRKPAPPASSAGNFVAPPAGPPPTVIPSSVVGGIDPMAAQRGMIRPPSQAFRGQNLSPAETPAQFNARQQFGEPPRPLPAGATSPFLKMKPLSVPAGSPYPHQAVPGSVPGVKASSFWDSLGNSLSQIGSTLHDYARNVPRFYQNKPMIVSEPRPPAVTVRKLPAVPGGSIMQKRSAVQIMTEYLNHLATLTAGSSQPLHVKQACVGSLAVLSRELQKSGNLLQALAVSHPGYSADQRQKLAAAMCGYAMKRKKKKHANALLGYGGGGGAAKGPLVGGMSGGLGGASLPAAGMKAPLPTGSAGTGSAQPAGVPATAAV